MKAVQILMGVTNKFQLKDWGAHQKRMKPPAKFFESLKIFNMERITPQQKAALKTPDLLLNPIFTWEYMMKKSSAAANLANWVINVIRYNDIINTPCDVPVKQDNQQPMGDDSIVDNEILLIYNNIQWYEQIVESTDDYHRPHETIA